MKIGKKVLSVMLATALAVTLGSCGKKQTVADGDIPTLVWYVPGDKQPDIDLINEAASAITMEKINAKLQLTFIDQGAYDEKISMIDASGEKYDLCFTGYLNVYKNAAEKGALYDITEMLDKVPTLVESLPEYVWEGAAIDGKIYGVPNYQILATTTGLTINKTLADKYNFDVSKITKTTDIEPFLKQVAENEQGIYPFRTNWGVAAFVSEGEDHQSKGQGIFEYAEKDGKVVVVPGFEAGNSKEKAKTLYDWYQKGYIRKDVASVMDDSQDARAGKYAVQSLAYKPGVESEEKIYMGDDVYCITLSKPVMKHDALRATMISVGANTRYPEEALKFIELVNTNKELYNIICFGVEGKHYNKIGENRIELIPNSGYNPNASWKFGNQFNAYLQPGQEDNVWEETKALNDSAVKSLDFGFDPDYTNIRTQYAQCTTVLSEYKVMDKGSSDPESYWAEFEKKMYDAGLQDIIDEVQKQLDEFLGQ